MNTVILSSPKKSDLKIFIDLAKKLKVSADWNFGEKTGDFIPAKNAPILGCAKGKMWFADDFDAPLEGFEEYM